MKKVNILIIDDEVGFTRMVKLNLECHGGYEVAIVNRAQEALAAAHKFKPDLILLDVIMPAMDGGEVAALLRADPLLQNVPILFLTATVSRPEAGHAGYSSGGFVFLAKPVSLPDLIAAIARQLDAGPAFIPRDRLPAGVSVSLAA